MKMYKCTYVTYNNLIGSLQFTDKLAGLGLPDTDLAVHGSGGDVGAVDAESDLGDGIGVPTELVQLLAVVQPPQVALVVAASGDSNVLMDGVQSHIVDRFWKGKIKSMLDSAIRFWPYCQRTKRTSWLIQ